MNNIKQKIKVIPNKVDRREKVDRRSFDSPTQVPIIDIKGKVIQKDRRSMPDRRIANIKIEKHLFYFDDDSFKKNMVASESNNATSLNIRKYGLDSRETKIRGTHDRPAIFIEQPTRHDH